MKTSITLGLLALVGLFGRTNSWAAEPPVRINQIVGQAELGTVELHGVGAASFRPRLWQEGALHIVPDIRSPLLSPRWAGVFRNIYAPSPVEVPGGWRVFYGAWDGVPTGNDRIYSISTADFLDFADRRTEIEHGKFIHVCNVNALRLADGEFRMVCTVYPDERDRNKPAFFQSPDGKAWNGSPAPYAAGPGDIVRVEGYEPYADADINGINVILYEEGEYRLYFGNYRQHGHVHRASSKDGKVYRYEGPCLASTHAVNDVKKLSVGGDAWYLMGLHMNTDRLWYSLSRDGRQFGPEQELGRCLGDADRYIVAIGWVLQGPRVLGFLYGAGPVKTLDRNRIFARWLQKKLVFTDASGRRFESAGALGPDRQLLRIGDGPSLDGQLQVFDEDGRTALSEPLPAHFTPGGVYQLLWNRPQ